MDNARQRREVDENYDIFQRQLASLLNEYRNHFALMRDQKIVAFYAEPGDAYREGLRRYDDQIFSIQEVTDEPVDLGIFSHAGS